MEVNVNYQSSGECFIVVPELTLSNTILFINTMWLLRESNHYLFDFKGVVNFTPVSLLYLSSEIAYFRKAREQSKFTVINYRHATYAAHMGFFRAFGAEFGPEPGQVIGNSSYLPITIRSADKLKQHAADAMVHVGEYIDRHIASRMAAVLVPDQKNNLYAVLAYCLREVLRNVIEHSQSSHYLYCAQYWPTKNKASLAILDRGIGIRDSLQSNPYLNITSDKVGLQLALSPAISGKMYKGVKKRNYDDWQNSGYGLYMTSEICKRGGSFFIASGESALELGQDKEIYYDVSLTGTFINLDINTANLEELNRLTAEISAEAVNKNKIQPSKASLSIINNSHKVNH
jgi:hypothetical protein